jgi:hypothetical protein
VQQAATLAASLAASPGRWPEFRARLHALALVDGGGGAAARDARALDAIDPLPLVAAAVALGWREKWQPS